MRTWASLKAAGQQSLMFVLISCGFGGGQLIMTALAVLVPAAACVQTAAGAAASATAAAAASPESKREACRELLAR